MGIRSESLDVKRMLTPRSICVDVHVCVYTDEHFGK